MNDVATGQVTRSAAEVYEEFFLPALFEQWTGPVADAAAIAPGQRVLDVACGTGVLARAVAVRVGPGGSVVGLDRNDDMLAVARRMAPRIDWRHGRAEALPFETGSFDTVVCQFGLMFFEDRRAALREMFRVLRPGGRLTVAVWDALDRSPGYAAVTALLEQLFGAPAADAMRVPFGLGDRQSLRALFVTAGIPDIEIVTRDGVARFASIRSWMHTDIRGWTLAEMIDAAQYERLLAEADAALRPFVSAAGNVSFRMPAHLVTATKPAIRESA